MNNEFVEKYEDLKRNKNLIASIDKDFFFDFVDYLMSERDELEKKIDELVEEQDEREKYTHELEEANAISKSSYMVGVLEERNKWFNRINKKFKELTQEEKETDGILMNTKEKKILEELIGKEE